MKKFIDYLEMLQNEAESKGLLFPTGGPQNLDDAFAKALELTTNPTTKEYQDLLILILQASNRNKKIKPKAPDTVLYQAFGDLEQRKKLQGDLKNLVTKNNNLEKLYIKQNQHKAIKKIKSMDGELYTDETVNKTRVTLNQLIDTISKQPYNDILSSEQIKTLQKDKIVKVGIRITILPEWLTMLSLGRKFIKGL